MTVPWFRVDDGFHCHPKVLTVGNAAVGLFCRLGSYCAQHLTDGRVPASLVHSYGRPREISALVHAGLIRRIGNSDVYELRDYLDWNWSRDKILAERSRNAERQKSWRDRHPGNAPRNAVTDPLGNGASNTAHSIPLEDTYKQRHEVATGDPQPVDLSAWRKQP